MYTNSSDTARQELSAIAGKFLKKLFNKTKHEIEIRTIPESGKILFDFFANIPDAIKYIKKHIHSKNIFFGVYTREGKKGDKEHVREATCLFSDMDLKEYKGGEEEAKKLLSNFIKPSVLIGSGHGYHAYWILKEPVLATPDIELYLHGIANELKSDHDVCEIARILRVPGTYNYKHKGKIEVKILDINDTTYTLEDFEPYKAKEEPRAEYQPSSENEYSLDFVIKNCAFIQHCYENSETLCEPLWYAMVSNIARLSNGINLVHELSKDHPNYRSSETDRKIIHALRSGPHTCEYIKEDMLEYTGSRCGKECDLGSPVAVLQKLKYAETAKKNEADDITYKWNPGTGLFKLKGINKKGEHEYIKISNFRGKIVKITTLDNGKDKEEELTIDLQFSKSGAVTRSTAQVLARKFQDIKWIVDKFPIQAIIEAGFSIKDMVRHSIQYISGAVEKEVVYTHTGWVHDDLGLFYVTGGGAIGRDNVKTKLGLESDQVYRLPPKPENEKEALRASLSFIDLGNKEITVPLWLFCYMSVFATIIKPRPNFILHLYGKTGSFKTTLSILVLSHFGSYADYMNGLGVSGFSSSMGSLEKRGFDLKDTIMLLDDYCPTKNFSESQMMYSILHRMIRNYSSGTARNRLNPDATQKGSYDPRGLLIVTGEDTIEGESTYARVLELDIRRGDIDPVKLTELQSEANLLPHAMSSFINWVIGHIDSIISQFPQTFIKVREDLSKSSAGLHKRQTETRAYMLTIAKLLKSFFVDKGAMTEEEGSALVTTVNNLLLERQERDAITLKEHSEVEIFYSTIEALIDQGKIYLFRMPGDEAECKDHCTSKVVERGEQIALGRFADDETPIMADPRLRGDFVGWYDDNYWYFKNTPVMAAFFKHHKDIGRQFSIMPKTIKKRLDEQGVLLHSEKGRLDHVVTINGRQIRVLALKRRNGQENEQTKWEN